jgi:glycosyltransferase involved in cell wall biosynthesis
MNNANPPLVSVAVITYKHEKFIGQCLEGIVMQKTNFRFEVIVAEDCSPDGTRKVVEEYEKKYPDIIKAIYQSKNVGAHRNAYEFLYPRLTGKYVAVCEGDDYWTDPYKLQKQIDYLEQHPEVSLTFHRVKSVDADDNMLTVQDSNSDIIYYDWKDIYHMHVPTLSAVYRNVITPLPKEIFKAFSGDMFTFGMLACHGNAADMGFIGAAYRKHAGGVFNSKSRVEQWKKALLTRRLMQGCSYFNKDQKREITKNFHFRKNLYMKHFLKKGEIGNFLNILFV